MNCCDNIKDYSPISYLDKLQELDIEGDKVSDISFLKNNKNIKIFHLLFWGTEDLSHISYLEKLEELYVNSLDISDISFLKINKNIKKLNLND